MCNIYMPYRVPIYVPYDIRIGIPFVPYNVQINKYIGYISICN